MWACVTMMRDTSRSAYPACSIPRSSAGSPSSSASARNTPQSTSVTRSPSASTYTLTLSMPWMPIGSATRVTPGTSVCVDTAPDIRSTSAVDAFQQREPDLEPYPVGHPGSVQYAGHLLHVEGGD